MNAINQSINQSIKSITLLVLRRAPSRTVTPRALALPPSTRQPIRQRPTDDSTRHTAHTRRCDVHIVILTTSKKWSRENVRIMRASTVAARASIATRARICDVDTVARRASVAVGASTRRARAWDGGCVAPPGARTRAFVANLHGATWTRASGDARTGTRRMCSGASAGTSARVMGTDDEVRARRRAAVARAAVGSTSRARVRSASCLARP